MDKPCWQHELICLETNGSIRWDGRRSWSCKRHLSIVSVSPKPCWNASCVRKDSLVTCFVSIRQGAVAVFAVIFDSKFSWLSFSLSFANSKGHKASTGVINAVDGGCCAVDSLPSDGPINIVMMSNSLVSTFLISLKTSIYKHFAEFKVGKSRRKNQSWCRVSACDVLHTVQKDAAFQAANTR